MSALTDLFTALANKIRSKTGGSATYTPPQMVNAIDDVYAAGAASVTVTSITPSNTSPVFIEIGSAYKPSKKGYAIESYDNSVTQSAMANGAYFPSGMVKMPIAGYAYSSRPQMTETTLWTNSNVANTFAEQTITLNDSITNYDYIKVTITSSTSTTTEYMDTIFKVSDFITYVRPSSSVNHWPQAAVGARAGGTSNFRVLLYVPDNKISISNGVAAGSTSALNSRVIPVKVIGMKL